MSAGRRSRRGAAVASVLVVGVAATAGVVLVLRALDAQDQPVRCAATLDGTDWYLTPLQAENAALLVGTSVRRGLPARAATIALATALQESRMENIDYGDRDSLGIFQQRPSQGWGTPEQIMDPVYSTGAFYDGLVEVDGYLGLQVTEAAQAVQRSAFPDAYAQHETRARAWASVLTGHSPGAVTCALPDDAVDAARGGIDGATALDDRLVRDLGLTGAAVAGDEGAVRVDAASLGGDVTTDAWTVAHWAVTTAAVTGASEVRAGGLVWTRGTGTWAALDGTGMPPAGQVTVVVP